MNPFAIARPYTKWALFALLLLLLGALFWPSEPVDVESVASKEVVAIAVDPLSPVHDESFAIAPVPASVPSRRLSRPTAFRASPQQRASDRQRARDALELAALVEEWELRARAGDVEALSWLLRTRLECQQFVLRNGIDPANFTEFETHAAAQATDPLELEILLSSARADYVRCGALTQTMMTDAWRADGRQLHQRRAQAGDARSRVEMIVPPQALSTPQGTAALERRRLAGIEVLHDQDPMDLATHAQVFQNFSLYDEHAWLMTACRLIPVCAGDPLAYSALAARGPSVANDHYLFAQIRELDAEQRQAAEMQSAEILRLWQQHRFQELLAGRPVSPGPGGG